MLHSVSFENSCFCGWREEIQVSLFHFIALFSYCPLTHCHSKGILLIAMRLKWHNNHFICLTLYIQIWRSNLRHVLFSWAQLVVWHDLSEHEHIPLTVQGGQACVGAICSTVYTSWEQLSHGGAHSYIIKPPGLFPTLQQLAMIVIAIIDGNIMPSTYAKF